MAQANSSIQVLDLDFTKIRSGLKTYLKSQPEFLDYDFEGSAISLLLDILAYNTYQNNFYTSMVGNEMFLDSAQLRDSVISRAKMLGYTPRSARSSSVVLTLQIFPDDDPFTITIPKETAFSTDIDGRTYTWYTEQAYVAEKDGNNEWKVDIEVKEGILNTEQHTVDIQNPVKYLISNENVDTSSLIVKVKESAVETEFVTYKLASDITEVKDTSNVYWLQETSDGKYEVIFGDGVIGNPVRNNNVVELSYRISSGKITNNVNTFTLPSGIAGYTNFTITVNDSTQGGDTIESIASIKFAAPKNYQTQNRAVLAEDYRRLILNEYGGIESLRVWGGETNSPPVYGKVFVSGRPFNGTTLSNSEKDGIRNFLKQHNVMSIEPEFIDPTYLYILPTVNVNWNSSITSQNDEDLRDEIITNILAFEEDNLGSFNNDILRYSRFLDAIDETNAAILGNETTFELQKRWYPNLNNTTKYTINFGNRLKQINPNNTCTLSSTAFTYDNGKTCFLDDDCEGNVQVYYLQGATRVYVTRTLGTINYSNGVIVLNSFQPEAVPTPGEIRITVNPFENDISVNKYQLMLFSNLKIRMTDSITAKELPAVTVNTQGSVTFVREKAIGTVI